MSIKRFDLGYASEFSDTMEIGEAPDGDYVLHSDYERELASLRAELEATKARIECAPQAIMDKRDLLCICAPEESAFPALYALQGHRVALVRIDGEKA